MLNQINISTAFRNFQCQLLLAKVSDFWLSSIDHNLQASQKKKNTQQKTASKIDLR